MKISTDDTADRQDGSCPVDRPAPEAPADPVNADRRAMVRSMGGFAVYVAPAMAVLLQGGSAAACHRPGHQPVPGQNCSTV